MFIILNYTNGSELIRMTEEKAETFKARFDHLPEIQKTIHIYKIGSEPQQGDFILTVKNELFVKVLGGTRKVNPEMYHPDFIDSSWCRVWKDGKRFDECKLGKEKDGSRTVTINRNETIQWS